VALIFIAARMELNRYDRVIWRVSGTLITVGGLIAVVLMLIVGYKLFREIFRDRRVNAVVNVNEETKQNEYLSLKRFSRIQGTDWLVARLDADQNYQQAYYSKSSSSTRNYLFFDFHNRSTHWLLSDNSSLILTDHELYEDGGVEREKRKVIGFVYEVVRKDTNGDNRLNWEDKKSLVLYRLSASRASNLLEAIDDFLGVQQFSANELLVFFRDNQKNYVISVDLASDKVSDKRELSAISANIQ
jgi:hypothetical protein